jgi:Cu/Ag efflux protein CusF
LPARQDIVAVKGIAAQQGWVLMRDKRQPARLNRIRFRLPEALAQSADFRETENRMKHFLFVAAVSLFAATAWAQAGHDHHAMPSAAKTAAGQADNTGEVRRVNAEAKKITIAHGPLKAYDMPPMTMAFAVKDPALIAKVKAGDKVRFALEKAGDDLVITRIETVK